MKAKKSTIIPLCLLAYLIVMAYMGRYLLYAGEYFQYFGIIVATLVIIVLLHFSLKKKERLRKNREDDINKSSK